LKEGCASGLGREICGLEGRVWFAPGDKETISLFSAMSMG